MKLPGKNTKKKSINKRHLYIVDENDRPPVQRQTNARSFSITGTSDYNAPKNVKDGPPFCMVTAARALYLSTLTYLEPDSRGLTGEKHVELHEKVERMGHEHAMKVVDVKEFYHKEGTETIRCLCYAGKMKKEDDGCNDDDVVEGKIEAPGETDEDNKKNAKKDGVAKSNQNQILIAFRGTDTVQNVFADLKAWTVSHPPERGSALKQTKPKVHHGFLKAWHNDDLRKNVLDFVANHVEDMRNNEISNMESAGLMDNPWPSILVTGHSLGGAVATLATYDIASELKKLSDNLTQNLSSMAKTNASILCKPNLLPYPRDKLRLYTYGCPRVGNVPFADSVNKLAPNSWNIIRDNDIVPAVPAKHATKFPSFKRVGRQVIINEDGTFYINPDRKMRRERELKAMKLTSSVASHETGNYRQSLLKVFEKEGLLGEGKNGEDGSRRSRELSKSKQSLQVAAEGLVFLGNIVTEARNDPNRSFRVLPGAT